MKLLPPDLREFRSPSGNFIFALSTADRWKTPNALGRLDAIEGNARRPLWQRELPHEKGPRRVLLSNTGAVVLVDEWINVPSRHALVLIDPEGRTLAHYGIDELIAILGVSRKSISENAKSAIWLSGEPSLRAGGASMEFRAGGRGLLLRLSDGQLTSID